MAGDFIGLDVTGLKNLQTLLEILPDYARDAIIEDVSRYVKGILSNPRNYPPSKYVSRSSAYGKTFFSDKQRRWFWAAVRSGEIQFPARYARTGKLAGGWKILGQGWTALIINETPYAGYVMGEAGSQSRHEAMVGWRTPTEVIEGRAEDVNKAADKAVVRAIKKAGG